MRLAQPAFFALALSLLGACLTSDEPGSTEGDELVQVDDGAEDLDGHDGLWIDDATGERRRRGRGHHGGGCGGPAQVCPPGESWVCYSGPAATDSVGACDRGIKTCNSAGTGYGACIGEILPTVEACDGIDNDCDGVVDDDCLCTAGAPSSCYDGPAGTEGVGTCQSGTQICDSDGSGHGACVGSIGPIAEICGDGLDNDCNGDVDQGCVCPPGELWVCYSGPSETDGVGACERGIKTCNADGLGYGPCVGETVPATESCNGIDDDCDGVTDEGCSACVPSPEVCGDGVDNDCDGTIDDGCVCAPGSGAACYDGPAGTEGVGTCSGGTSTCNADGTGYGACVGSVGPTVDVCGDGLDNDCDGSVDDGCVCAPGSGAACYDGPAGTEGVGVCAAGVQTCNGAGSGYGACVGSIGPSAELCSDGLDNDCDGVIDDGCVCAPDSAAACYDGPVGTAGVGVCAAGAQTCNATGTGYGACVGSIGPGPEVCGDGLDNDCDGVSDEGCVCAPGAGATCYDGPAGTAGVGVCAAGAQTCNADGTGYGACVGSVGPSPEVCGDGLDNDCDGVTDDSCVCEPDTTGSCYSGPAGTAGVGVCVAGARQCNATGTGFGVCVGAVGPGAEVCGDGLDNDCDGFVDEGCIGDRAWRDFNVNGVQNPGEPGAGGITFLLRTASGALVAVTTSNAAGVYYFSNIPPGAYRVEVVLPFGYGVTSPNLGGNDNLDSDFDGETMSTGLYTLPANGSITHIDIGLVGGPT